MAPARTAIIENRTRLEDEGRKLAAEIKQSEERMPGSAANLGIAADLGMPAKAFDVLRLRNAAYQKKIARINLVWKQNMPGLWKDVKLATEP